MCRYDKNSLQVYSVHIVICAVYSYHMTLDSPDYSWLSIYPGPDYAHICMYLPWT